MIDPPRLGPGGDEVCDLLPSGAGACDPGFVGPIPLDGTCAIADPATHDGKRREHCHCGFDDRGLVTRSNSRVQLFSESS